MRKCIKLTYDYSMAKHQNVIECSATGRHQKQLNDLYEMKQEMFRDGCVALELVFVA